MKKFSALPILALMLSLCPLSAAAVEAPVPEGVVPVTILIDGETFSGQNERGETVAPFAYDGTTYVPIRALGNVLGYEVSWDPEKACVVVDPKGKPTGVSTKTDGEDAPLPPGVSKIDKILIGKKVFSGYNERGEKVAPFAYDGTTYVPIRGLGICLKYEVGWDAATSSVTVTTGNKVSSGSGKAEKPVQTTAPASGDRVLVSAAAPVESGEIGKDSNVVQDMYHYMPKSMSFENVSTSGKNGQQSRSFQGNEDSLELIQGYVDSLCATGNFRLVDSYEKTYKSTFFSYALTYTGTAGVSGDKSEMNFKKDVYGDVTIYGTLERSRCKGSISIVRGLEFDDLGLRSDGSQVSVTAVGQSLHSELYRLSDGSYETGDGRFHVPLGKAQIYRDGTVHTIDARLLRNKDKNWEELHIDNFYRSDSILFTSPYNSLLTGDMFDQQSMGLNQKSNNYEKYADSMDDFLSWKFSNKLVGVCHDGDYLYCYRDNSNGFAGLSVRIMCWDADREEAVIYLCAQFDTAPYEYEALAAVKMETAQAAGSGFSGGSSSGSSSSDIFDSDDNNDRPMRIRCTFVGCHDGKVRCSACNGEGGKWVYDNSTPQYDGVYSHPSRDWEDCYKCHGDKEVDCSRCGGTGWIDLN